jgi:hypothetical protein
MNLMASTFQPNGSHMSERLGAEHYGKERAKMEEGEVQG